jgi:hypothetical protein
VSREIADAELGDRIDEYWGWVAVALFLLTAVDVLTTLGAAAVVGVGREANPFVRWLLEESVLALVAVNLVVVVVGAVGFRGVVATLWRTPPRLRPYYLVVIEVWLGLLVAAGLAVFATNLVVIVVGVTPP